MRGGLWVLCAEVQKSQNASPVLKVLPPPRGGGGLGGRIVLTKSEIKFFCDIDTRFPWKTRHIPTPKMFGGSNETIFLHFGGLRNTQNGEN